MGEEIVQGTRRPERALTAQFVRNVKEPGKYFDGQGLFLRVEKNGSRFWVQRITIRGKRCELGLGSPTLVTLAEAREVALVNRKLARAGGDPLAAKKQAQAVLTFEEAARKVHELHKPTWRNAKHAAQFISTMETYAFPYMGNLKVADVTTADVLRVLTPIWTQKPETARRVRQRIGTIMKWAVAQGWRQDNPAEAIAQALPKQDKTQKHRKALPYSEVANCIDVVKSSQAGATTKLALEFLVLTATRSGETRLARWTEFDFHGATTASDAVTATWVVPPERMKAKKEHRIPISERALGLLKDAEAMSDGSEFVFPGTQRGKPLSDMTLSKLVKELGFDADVHGFRTSFRTWAQERTSFPREVAEAALAHTIKDKAEAAYARSDLFEKRTKMMESWAIYLNHGYSNIVRIK
ncbi:Integrase [Shimia gijangensis]|uniref:Integrase n=1 Tax=Shimia gijangensis TaxID=1470563 RepID=A0A1M6TD98_9RHOB|nr:site-specific integrase [Shimia gijangensis]SHK54941.1 Integrase [Shimia gijangensis]